jgi:chromosomal replication initiation ATPase DnaA
MNSVTIIAAEVSRATGIPIRRIIRRDTSARACEARHLAMAMVRRKLGYTYERIAKTFHRRDHTSVLYAVRQFAKIAARPHISAALPGMERRISVRLKKRRDEIRASKSTPWQ